MQKPKKWSLKTLEDDLVPEADVTQKDTADVLVEKPDNTEDNFGSVVIDDELYQVSIPRNARFLMAMKWNQVKECT